MKLIILVAVLLVAVLAQDEGQKAGDRLAAAAAAGANRAKARPAFDKFEKPSLEKLKEMKDRRRASAATGERPKRNDRNDPQKGKPRSGAKPKGPGGPFGRENKRGDAQEKRGGERRNAQEKKRRGPGPKGEDAFGPCQACYAVVASFDEVVQAEEDLTNYDMDAHCKEKHSDYSVVMPPRGHHPMVQGPGLPDLKEKLKDLAEELKPAGEKHSMRFVGDFTRVCQTQAQTFNEKFLKMFEVPDKLEDEQAIQRWRGGVRRKMCAKYCNRRKAKMEL